MARRHVLHDLCYFALAMQIKKIRKATFYESAKCVVKMTGNRHNKKGARQLIYSVTIGAPNYAERQFIKQCKKSGVSLPSRKGPLFKYWPAKKRGRK